MADAAWFGFLVTALNLLPAGQLDGGRIGYALFPRHHGRLGRLTVAALITLGVAVAALLYVARPEGTSLIPGVNRLLLGPAVPLPLRHRHRPGAGPPQP